MKNKLQNTILKKILAYNGNSFWFLYNGINIVLKLYVERNNVINC